MPSRLRTRAKRSVPSLTDTERHHSSPTHSPAGGVLSRMVVPLAVGQDVGLRVPGRLELLFRVQRSLVEPVRGTRIARFAELKNRLHLRLRRQLDCPDEGMASYPVAALLAHLGQRVEIE